ncbi:receptor-like protein kinase FERONIA isoform X2 [Lactuca sativa]|uniref:receptor-like protein kinase FERONIA isoform X2 n=1 Tax=Lactuca sativa TaxID=4236 RepID=UPI000CD860EE|nr:receptor-like protein kinase FERONIA isoform X2 [Lactuca sativa]
MSFATDGGREPEPSTSAPASASTSISTSVGWSQPCRNFEFPEILLATENFDESLVIGRGGFGKVYRGKIINGSSFVVAAIKRLDSMSNQGAAEFWAEVDMLSKLRHCHLVSLIGYCNHGKEMILVYEYMPHGTLEDHLHKLSTPLSWVQRLKICIGAARGLDYLHTGTGIGLGVIHRDVKSSNILLHETWAAKISDFGLSRIGPTNQPSTYVNTLVKGTFGYLDPNYFTTGRLTRKSDVYSFGVVLLEVLCRKRAVDKSLDEEQWGLVGWAQEYIKEGKLKHIVDSDIRDQISTKCLKEFIGITERCLLSNPKQRPMMTEVVFSLDCALTLQEKTNTSLQAAGKTIFSRMVDMLPFPSSGGENSAHSDPKLSSNNNGDMFLEVPNSSLKVFKFADLKKATSNFSDDLVLGQGAFGKVLLGWIDKKTFVPSRNGVGIPVAVKRCSASSTHGHSEWLSEVRFLGCLAHSNIISLLGYCNHEQEYLLVYEYMQNRSLDRFLYRSAHVRAQPLSWKTRLIILIGVARGLTYVHSSKDEIIHRGFGLARSGSESGKTHVSTRVVGNNAILAPEYVATGHLSVKCDIYSFGAVFLETLTGLKANAIMVRYETHDLAKWVSLILEKRRKLKLIIDPSLDHNYPQEGAFALLTLASKCFANQPKDRPSSEEVLLNLEQIYTANEY